MTRREIELHRSHPEFVCYAPADTCSPDSTNQHFIVQPTREGAFLAVWTQASAEAEPDQRIVYSRSEDRGVTWTHPEVLEDASDGAGRIASWAFSFVVPRSRRIYVFFNKSVGVEDVRRDTTGEVWYRWSEDDGRTWSREHGKLEIRRSAISHPDPRVPESWITYQAPITGSRGDVMAGFTRWASSAVSHGGDDLFHRMSEAWFFRFDNMLTEDDPLKVKLTTLPRGDVGLRVPRPDAPEVSVAQEPSIQELSDGRLICVMRTLTGMIWHSISADGGETWSPTEPLRYRPDGPPILHPLAPAPLYRLGDGRFILFHHSNDGTINGASGPADTKRNRNPTFISVGREIPGDAQPIVFSGPRQFADSQFMPYGARPNIGIGSYGSLFEYEGKVYYWYPDRKHFLLGRILTEELLDDSGLVGE